jgi:hypothetical protein
VTVPLIVTLVVAPSSILALIGPEYVSAANAISKFNNLGKPRQIIVIGSIHVIVFLVAFVLLVPTYGTVSIVSGLAAGYAVRLIFGSSVHPFIVVLFSVSVVAIVIFVLRNTSPNEILLMARGLLR